MRDLLGKFFTHLVHLDSKFVRMAWQLWIPAKVTTAYFSGKTSRYPHPVQYFFIVMFFFLIVLGKSCEESAVINVGKQNSQLKIGTPKTAQSNSVKLDNFNLFEAMQRYTQGLDFEEAYDSLPPHLRTSDVKTALDSVLQRVNGDWELALRIMQDDYEGSMDTIPLRIFNREIKVGLRDIIHLPPEGVVEKYNIEKWWEKIAVKQSLKSIRDPKGLMHSYVGSYAWTTLLLIALMAAMLKILYWRQRRYYVEHFIFLMHQNAGAYLLLTLLLALGHWVAWWPDWISLLGIAWIAVSLLLAMKRYYGQKWPITTFKWLVYSFLYLLFFTILFALSMLAVFAMF